MPVIECRIDVNGAADVSGTLTVAGNVTVGGVASVAQLSFGGVTFTLQSGTVVVQAGASLTTETLVLKSGTFTNTAGNAIETTVWMKKHEYRSLRLVTAAYHMPRSLLEFGHAMPGVTLIPHPVFPEKVKQDYWWGWPGTASLMVGEYDKYLLAWLRHWVGRLLEKVGIAAGAGKGTAKTGI